MGRVKKQEILFVKYYKPNNKKEQWYNKKCLLVYNLILFAKNNNFYIEYRFVDWTLNIKKTNIIRI